MSDSSPKLVQPALITAPAPNQRVRRMARFAKPGERRSRYALPDGLVSGSPVGYRTRISLTKEDVSLALSLLSLARPTAFIAAEPVTDQRLFEESSLGVLTARQSTNFLGHRQVTLVGDRAYKAQALLALLQHREAPVLPNARHVHLIWSRPYRTPFTFFLTFVGHKPISDLLTVPRRALSKAIKHRDDIPTIGYLRELHLGILADAMERAAVIASDGADRAQVLQGPFVCDERRRANAPIIAELEALSGMTRADRRAGWRLSLGCQVGVAVPDEQVALPRDVARRLGANLMAFRSERIQPGVNQEDTAPAAYQSRQEMDVPEELAVQCGRAAYNAFAHWTGIDREQSKHLMLLERVDVLSPHGKCRLRQIRGQLSSITEEVIRRIPKWADLATGKALTRNASRGRKAFALTGQRVYIVGLSRQEVEAANLPWELGVRAVGAACARGALVAELMGVTELPDDCDLLAGVCLMAGPVNQNDIGKSFYGARDLLAESYPDRDPTSLLVWTLKAKSVADPIGNEQQLMDPKNQGALVDLRPAPHAVIAVAGASAAQPFRKRGAQTSEERAFADLDNFVTDPEGVEIPGNRGASWAWGEEALG